MNIPTQAPLLPSTQTNCSFTDLFVDLKELYILMGYGNQEPDEGIQTIIQDILKELEEICSPSYGFSICRGGKKDKEHLWVEDKILNTGAIITSALREAEYFALFTATIGNDFDQYVHKLQKQDDMVKAFIADSLGSILVEACVSLLMKSLEESMQSSGWQTSNNYSPGYCDWQLTEQEKLFSFFPPHFCGITLTSSFLMLPVKSVSGIIGIGEKIRKRAYGCEICTMKNCAKKKR